MIITMAGMQDHAVGKQLMANLAVLRARSGHAICIIDADPRARAYDWSCERSMAGHGPSIPARRLTGRALEHEIDVLAPDYHDLLINTGERDTHESRAALGAAHTVIVPVRVRQADLEKHYGLVARLNAARMFNPQLRVLFVVVIDGAAPAGEELAAVRHYVAHVMSATLATTFINNPCAYEYGRGRCVCDAETCDPEAAAEFRALYREIYPH